MIYKKDTDEAQLTNKALDRIIKANDLEQHLSSNFEAKVIHNENIGMFMNLDQKFYVSVAVLRATGMREEELALMLCHELAHYLLDH